MIGTYIITGMRLPTVGVVEHVPVSVVVEGTRVLRILLERKECGLQVGASAVCEAVGVHDVVMGTL